MAGEEMLSYMITAHDLASPVFRAFTGQVDAMSKSVQASLKELNAQLAETERRMGALGDTARASAAKTDTAAASTTDAAAAASVMGGTHQSTSAAVQDTSKALEEHKQSLEDVIAAATAANAKSVQMETEEGKVKVAFQDTTKEVDKHKQSIEELLPVMGSVGSRADDLTGKLGMLRKHGVDYVAAGVVGIEGAFAGFGVKSAIEFDNMNKEIQAQTGVTKQRAADLVTIAEQVGSKVPVSFSEIGTAIGAEYKLFGANLNLIKANTDGMLAFANQAGGGTQNTIQQLSAVMRNFHPAGQSVVDVMDDLTRLSQRSQVPLSSYMTLLSKYGPQLKVMGVGFNEATGLFDTFSKKGVTVTQMARGMQTALAFSTKAIKEQHSALMYEGQGGMDPFTKAVLSARDALQELKTGTSASTLTNQEYDEKLAAAKLTLKDATDKWVANKQVVDIATRSHDSISKILQNESVQIADAKNKTDAMNLSMEVFGNRIGPSMEAALFRQKGGLEGLRSKLGDTKGAIEQLAAAERDTVSGQLTILENQFTVISATVGKDLLPALKDGVGLFRDVATGVQQFSTGSTADIAKVTAAVVGVSSGVLLLTRHIGLLSKAAGAVTSDGSFLQKLLMGKNAPASAPSSSSTGPATRTIGGSGEGGTMPTLVGFSGKPDLVGSEMNPIAVQVVGEGMGGPGETEEPAESPAAVGAEERGEEPALMGGGGKGESKMVGAAEDEAPVEAEISEGSMLSMSSVMGNAMKGGMVALGGSMVSHLAGGLIGGKAGSDVSKIGTDASIGAGAGMLLGPEGALIGGGVGALVGAASSLFGGNSASDATDKLAASVKKAASDDNIKALQKLRDTAAGLGDKLNSLGASGGAALVDLANKVSAALPQMEAATANAADAMSGPLQTALTQISGEYGFPAVTKAVEDTSDSVQQKSAAVVTALTNIADSGSGPMAKNAKLALDQLKSDTETDTGAMAQQVVNSMATIKTQIQDGSKTASAQASTNMGLFATAVQANMQSGVTTTTQGITDIITVMNGALKALGDQQLSAPKLRAITAAYTGNAGGGVKMVPGAATGARVPGAVGPDNWTLLDPHGIPAGMVGGGELLVSNRHTEAKVNSLLPAGITLGGLVAGETTPHSAPGYATGGIPTPSVSGGGDTGVLIASVLSAVARAANKDLSASSASAGGGGGGRQQRAPKGSSTGLLEMINEANSIASHNYNYEWGGGHGGLGVPSHGTGHGSGPGVGFDCSGAVSAVLGSAGLVNSPMVAQQYMNWGSPGAGKYVNIYADPVHTFMEIAGHYFGTSTAQNPGGGANWIPTFPGNIGGPRHPAGYATGGWVLDPTQLGGAIRSNLVPGMSHGGVAYAGAFGNGGSFTAHGPTVGLFGEKGIEHVTAVPGYATGGTPTNSQLLNQLNQELSKIPNVAPPAAASTVAAKKAAATLSEHIDPLTGKKVDETAAAYSAQSIQYSLLTKALSKTVTDILTLDGQVVGSIQTSRSTLKKDKLPYGVHGGDVDVTSGLLGTVTQSGMSSLETAFTKSLQRDTVPQLIKLTETLAGEGGSKLAKVRGSSLADASLTAMTKTFTNDAVPQLIKIASTLTGLTGSRTVRDTAHTEAGKALTAASTTYGSQVTGTEDQYQHELTIQGLIEGLGKGQSPRKLGLTSTELKASGLTKRQIRKLSGTTTAAGSSPAVYAQEEADAKQEDATLASEEKRTSALYQAALKDHQTKLANSLKTQLDAITQARLTADQAVTAAQISAIDDASNKAQTAATNATNNSSLATTIQGMAAGSSTGISNSVLRTLGISGVSAGQTSVADTNAADAPLVSAQQQSVTAMNNLEKSMNTLSGPALTEAQSQLSTLAGTVASLDTTIQNNLITAINNQVAAAATIATGQQAQSDITTTIEGLTPGTNLASLGLSPAVLATLGMGDPNSLEGTAGTYTGALGVNAGLQAEETTDEGSLSSLESELPSLTGSALTTAQQQITQLVESILGLQTTIQSNTQAVAANTTASTTSTGQLTGSVGYAYQNQDFVAGAMSSDSTSNTGVGL